MTSRPSFTVVVPLRKTFTGDSGLCTGGSSGGDSFAKERSFEDVRPEVPL